MADKIVRFSDGSAVKCPRESVRDAKMAYRMSDGETLTPAAARKVFGDSDPTKHNYMRLDTALRALGCRPV